MRARELVAERDVVDKVAADQRLDVRDRGDVGEVAERSACRSPAPRSIDAFEASAPSVMSLLAEPPRMVSTLDDGRLVGAEVREGDRVEAVAEIDDAAGHLRAEGDRVGARAADQGLDVRDGARVLSERAERQLVLAAAPRSIQLSLVSALPSAMVSVPVPPVSVSTPVTVDRIGEVAEA